MSIQSSVQLKEGVHVLVRAYSRCLTYFTNTCAVGNLTLHNICIDPQGGVVWLFMNPGVTHSLINWLGSTQFMQMSWICIYTHTYIYIYGVHKSAILVVSWRFLCWRQEIVHRICNQFGYTCTVYSTDPIREVTSLAKFWLDPNCTARFPGTSPDHQYCTCNRFTMTSSVPVWRATVVECIILGL